MKWADTSTEQRNELLKRYESKEDLTAESYEMGYKNAGSLERRLRA